MFIIQTDKPCKNCGDVHGYVTKNCDLAVYVDELTAHMVAQAVKGGVEEIEETPAGAPYVLFIQRGGVPDPRYPRTATAMPGSVN